jgi:hypothetical protein
MYVCITLPDGTKWCFEIPLIINYWNPNPPDPGPPWLRSAIAIKREVIRDLSALATINALSASLSAGSRRAVQAMVKTQIESLKLPKGLQVEQHAD